MKSGTFKRRIALLLSFVMVMSFMSYFAEGALAEEKAEKFRVTVSSKSIDGNIGAVSGKVLEDFTAELDLTGDYVNTSNVTVGVFMKDVASLGIEGERNFERTFRLRNDDGGDVSMNSIISTFAPLDGTRLVVTSGDAEMTYEVSKLNDRKFALTPDSEEAASAVWSAIVNSDNVESGTSAKDDSYIVIANGSYLNVGDSILQFREGYDDDLVIDDFSQISSLNDKIRDAAELVPVAEFDGVRFVLKAGTELALGQSYVKLKQDMTVEIRGNRLSEFDVILEELQKLQPGDTDGSIRIMYALLQGSISILGGTTVYADVEFGEQKDIEEMQEDAIAELRAYAAAAEEGENVDKDQIEIAKLNGENAIREAKSRKAVKDALAAGKARIDEVVEGGLENDDTFQAAKVLIDELTEKVEKIEQDLADLEEAMGDYATKEELQAAVEKAEDELAAAKQAIEAAQAARDKAQDDALAESVADMYDKIEAAKQAAADADADVLAAAKAYTDVKVGELQSQIDTNKEAIEALQSEQISDQDVQDAIDAAQDEIEAAQKAVDDAQDAALVGEVGKLNKAIEDAAKAAQDANVATLEAAKAYTDLKVGELQAEIDKLKAEMAQNSIDSVATTLKASASGYDSAKAVWNSSKITVAGQAVKYTLYGKTTADTEWTKLYEADCKGDGKAMEYEARELKTGSTYELKVVPSLELDGKVYEGSESLTEKVKLSLGKAKLGKIKRGKAKLTVTWKAVAGADGYRVYYKDGKKKAKMKFVNGPKLKKVLKKLKRKHTYTVKVRAFRNVDGSKVFGAWSTAKKAKVK